MECWLAALWEAGEGTGVASLFASYDMVGVAGLAESEPSPYRKSSRGRVRLLIGGAHQKLIG